MSNAGNKESLGSPTRVLVAVEGQVPGKNRSVGGELVVLVEVFLYVA